MKLKALVVDDELLSVQNLQLMLNEHCTDVELVGYATDISEAIDKINSLYPDLLFLDIDLSGSSGFDLLEAFTGRSFDVIFTTAYDEYALKAIKEQALDYLLKPIDSCELLLAVAKAFEKRMDSDPLPLLKQISENLSRKDFRETRLQIPFESGIQFVEINKIVRCKSDNNYSEVFLEGHQRIFCTLSLADIEARLKSPLFVRVHNSHLVNVNYITKYYRNDGGMVELVDGTKIPVSRRKKEELTKMFRDYD